MSDLKIENSDLRGFLFCFKSVNSGGAGGGRFAGILPEQSGLSVEAKEVL